MGDIGFLIMILFSLIGFVLMAFAAFMIGFLFGYKKESKIFLKRKVQQKEQLNNTEMEKKIKKEWKNFLEYDGSVPYGND